MLELFNSQEWIRFLCHFQFPDEKAPLTYSFIVRDGLTLDELFDWAVSEFQLKGILTGCFSAHLVTGGPVDDLPVTELDGYLQSLSPDSPHLSSRLPLSLVLSDEAVLWAHFSASASVSFSILPQLSRPLGAGGGELPVLLLLPRSGEFRVVHWASSITPSAAVRSASSAFSLSSSSASRLYFRTPFSSDDSDLPPAQEVLSEGLRSGLLRVFLRAPALHFWSGGCALALCVPDGGGGGGGSGGGGARFALHAAAAAKARDVAGAWVRRERGRAEFREWNLLTVEAGAAAEAAAAVGSDGRRHVDDADHAHHPACGQDEDEDEDEDEDDDDEDDDDDDDGEWALQLLPGGAPPASARGRWWLHGSERLLAAPAPRWRDALALRARPSDDALLAAVSATLPSQLSLLRGELPLLRLEGVTHLAPQRTRAIGSLTLTSFRLAFAAYDRSSYADVGAQERADARVPFGCVRALRVWGGGGGAFVHLLCRDFRCVVFALPRRDQHARQLIERLRRLLPPLPRSNCFAFYHFDKPSGGAAAAAAAAKGAEYEYDAIREYRRARLLRRSVADFRLTDANAAYALCASYPALLVVPARVSDALLQRVAEFRGAGRFPAALWRHRCGATLLRSAQPRIGLRGHRCAEDEFCLQAVREVPVTRDNGAAEAPARLVIVDARPVVNARANRMRQGGSEDVGEAYRGCELRFMGIANIHAMRSAHERLMEAVLPPVSARTPSSTTTTTNVGEMIDTNFVIIHDNSNNNNNNSSEEENNDIDLDEISFSPPSSFSSSSSSSSSFSSSNNNNNNNDGTTVQTWMNNLAGSHWLDHILNIMNAALFVTRLLDRECAHVLVHCSDGWDRTPQITALAQLLLDPHFRTLQGFVDLIEKEWLSFGHRFVIRLGVVATTKGSDSRGESPVFLQFIDCVWQVMEQFGSAFEFNEALLLEVLDQLYTCRFGTFLASCEKDRVEWRLHRKTHSLWEHIFSQKEKYLNPLYHRNSTPEALYPRVSAFKIKLWDSYYLRYHF